MMFKTRFAIVLVLSLMASSVRAAAGLHSAAANITNSETVTANIGSLSGVTIPANFIGISWEPQLYANGVFNGASGASLAGSFCLLGPNGVFRMGGSTGDGNTSSASYSQTLANNLASFLSGCGSGWSLIFQIDYNATQANQLLEASYVVNAFGQANAVLAIGNEPTLGSTYTTQWNSDYANLHSTYSTIKFEGPECLAGCSSTDVDNFASATTPGFAGLAYGSYHTYEGSNYYAVPQTIIGFAIHGIGAPISTDMPGKVRLGEFNTESGGGYQGVSDRMVASTWYLDSMMNLSALGYYAGTNVHERGNDSLPLGPRLNPTGAGTNAAYSAFIQQSDGGWTPAAPFYGPYLYTKIEGFPIVSTTNSGTCTVQTQAVKTTNGNSNILVVNNDPVLPCVVTPVQSSGSWTTANVWNMASITNASCGDSRVGINGTAIGEGGANAPVAATIANGGTVTLVPCGAAVISIQP